MEQVQLRAGSLCQRERALESGVWAVGKIECDKNAIVCHLICSHTSRESTSETRQTNRNLLTINQVRSRQRGRLVRRAVDGAARRTHVRPCAVGANASSGRAHRGPRDADPRCRGGRRAHHDCRPSLVAGRRSHRPGHPWPPRVQTAAPGISHRGGAARGAVSRAHGASRRRSGCTRARERSGAFCAR
jgi:hypothetical protein